MTLEQQEILIHSVWEYIMEILIVTHDDQARADFRKELLDKCIAFGLDDIKKVVGKRHGDFKEDVSSDKDRTALARNMIMVGRTVLF